MTYHEITGKQFYEYRYDEHDAGHFSGWIVAGSGSTALDDIFAGLPQDDTVVQIRLVCPLADDSGTYVGDLLKPVETFGGAER